MTDVAKLLRQLFQLAAFCLFIYQMQQACRKYADPPVVTQQSTTTIKSIQKPEIYICQEGQYNYTRSRSFGYRFNNNLLAGYLVNATTLHWKGMHKNESFESMKKSIFQYNYSDVIIANRNDLDFAGDIIKTKLTFVNPYGFCLKLENFTKAMNILVKTATIVKVIFTDSNIADEMSVLEQQNSYVESRLKYESLKAAIYSVRYEVHDSRLFDGKLCLDYEKIGSSYGKCVQMAVEQQLLKWYDCLPPWFLSSDVAKRCSHDQAKRNITTSEIWEARVEINKLLMSQPMKVMAHCQKPCVNIDIALTKFWSRGNMPTENRIFLHPKTEGILVHTAAYSYDLFNLVVDLGSSLGLWLGFSALGIFDALLEQSKNMLMPFVRKLAKVDKH